MSVPACNQTSMVTIYQVIPTCTVQYHYNKIKIQVLKYMVWNQSLVAPVNTDSYLLVQLISERDSSIHTCNMIHKMPKYSKATTSDQDNVIGRLKRSPF